MLIERVWAANAGRNFHYLIACGATGEALAVDPLDAARCLRRARELGWTIRQIFNTHEHVDHTGGNADMVAATGAAVLAHRDAAARIEGVTHGLNGGDSVRIGRSVELRCLDTPGHTRAHLCLYGSPQDNDVPALFSGDTLFNAGVGNCIHGGDPRLLYDSFSSTLSRLPDATRVFPGHEYLVRNLGFTLDREPSNAAAREMAQRCSGLAAENMPVTNLGQERQFNAFLRLESPEIIEGLRSRTEWKNTPGPREVFLALRELRNRW
jgi:hydroxyacylglutathione hydrolase